MPPETCPGCGIQRGASRTEEAWFFHQATCLSTAAPSHMTGLRGVGGLGGRVTHPLPGYRLFLFDADGTLRETVVDGVRQPRPPNHHGEWQILPHVQEVLACYDWTQVAVAVCSNQGGVGLGYIPEATARFMLTQTLSMATRTPVHTAQVWMCPHMPHAGCACRKPQPLLLQRAIHQWQQAQSAEEHVLYGLSEVLYVGDQDSDREAAKRCGVDFCTAADFFGWEDAP